MTPIASLLTTNPTITASSLKSIWPVHRNSFRVLPGFTRISKENAYALYRRARQYDRKGRIPNQQRGTLGSAALRVLETLIFDFYNFSTGRLDPAYEAIARKANLARSTVALALKKLAALGIIKWLRRCEGDNTPNGWRLRQISNAYELAPYSNWLAYINDDPDPPPPHPDTIGAHPPLPSLTNQAAAELQQATPTQSAITILSQDPNDSFALALARLGTAILESEKQTESGSTIKRF